MDILNEILNIVVAKGVAGFGEKALLPLTEVIPAIHPLVRNLNALRHHQAKQALDKLEERVSIRE